MSPLKVLWMWSAVMMAVLVEAENYCYSDDELPYNLFGTKTVYEIIRNKKISNGNIPKCEAVMVWMLMRHGTRYPHVEEIAGLKDLPNLRDTILRNDHSPRILQDADELCYEDKELLKRWNFTTTVEDADKLTSSGVTETHFLAKRLKSFFPLLNTPYSPQAYKIRFTGKVRTKQTAQAFTQGLFEETIPLDDSFVDQHLLEANNNCSRWKKSSKNEGAEKQIESFRTGKLMRDLISSVSNKLGFTNNLPYSSIADMYNMCRFDKAWHPKDESAWCSVFNKDQLEILEYNEDLEYYYRSGYGNPYTTMLGCPLIRDLIDTFNNRTLANETDAGEPVAVLNFGHSLTVRSALVKLGMANDVLPISAQNYFTNAKRQWRTSFINPFAANLVAVLYKCSEAYKVMFYLNEQYVDYTGCDVGLCNWTYIYERFAPTLDPAKCNLDFCSDISSSSALHSSLLLPFILLVALISFSS